MGMIKIALVTLFLLAACGDDAAREDPIPEPMEAPPEEQRVDISDEEIVDLEEPPAAPDPDTDPTPGTPTDTATATDTDTDTATDTATATATDTPPATDTATVTGSAPT